MMETAQKETKERERHPIQKYFRKERFPTMFCPGCGNGIVMSAVMRAIDNLTQFNIDNTVFVSGIGCAGRIPGYILADSIHTTHGRAIPVATGIKMFRPDLEVIVFGGDLEAAFNTAELVEDTAKIQWLCSTRSNLSPRT